jgi:hypothetical protein
MSCARSVILELGVKSLNALYHKCQELVGEEQMLRQPATGCRC